MFDQGESLNMVILLQKEPAAFPGEELARARLAEQPLRPGDQQSCTLRGIAAGLPGDRPRAENRRRNPAIAAARAAPQDSHAGPGRPLSTIATGRRRLLRLLPAAVGQVGHFHCRRERPRHPRRGADGCHALHRSRPPRPGRRRPAQVLAYLNHHLVRRYTADNRSFVTAFYGVYDPATQTLTYAVPATTRRASSAARTARSLALDRRQRLPLGIADDQGYDEPPSNCSPATRSSSTPTASPRPATQTANSSAPTASTASWKTARCSVGATGCGAASRGRFRQRPPGGRRPDGDLWRGLRE